MLKAVSNQSDSTIKLGGVKIKSKEQSQIRESLITKDEMETLKDIGLVVSFSSIITVKMVEKKPKRVKKVITRNVKNNIGTEDGK